MPDRNSEVYSVDARKEGFVVDLRPTTLLEQSLMGHDRVNAPVGSPTMPRPEIQTTGGRNIGDAIDAIRIGASGRKK